MTGELSKLPGIGRRTALRLAIHLLRMEPDSVSDMTRSIDRFRRDIKYCKLCNNLSDEEICPICADRELLARLIQCEAGGEGEDGMKAVAGVVMNRVHAKGGEYARVGQGSIRNIIFQPGQFVCASETERGSYNPQNIYNMRPTDIHYEIADWAIAGNRLNGLGTALWFFNPFSPSCRANFPSNVGTFVMRIGDHCFYNPTAAYYDT